MRLEWVGTSFEDLAGIYAYISQYNPDAADRVAAEIDKTTRQLLLYPQLGRLGLGGNVRLLQVPRLPYLIPYRVYGEIIEILAVFDERQKRPEGWL